MWYAHKQHTHTHTWMNESKININNNYNNLTVIIIHESRIVPSAWLLLSLFGWIGIAANSSYDEDDDYEPNIDILESQLDDSILNEWWDTVKVESAEDFERAERAIQEHLERL